MIRCAEHHHPAPARGWPVANITCLVERNHPPICHSERSETESRNLPKWQVLSCGVHYPTWWIPPLRLHSGRNDTMGERGWYFRKQLRPFRCGNKNALESYYVVRFKSVFCILNPSPKGRPWLSQRERQGGQPLAGAGWRWVNAATLFHIWGGTIHPHRLLLPRGGRQVAAPTLRDPFAPIVFGKFQVAPRPSSVSAAPSQLPRRGSFCTGLWGAYFFI